MSIKKSKAYGYPLFTYSIREAMDTDSHLVRKINIFEVTSQTSKISVPHLEYSKILTQNEAYSLDIQKYVRVIKENFFNWSRTSMRDYKMFSILGIFYKIISFDSSTKELHGKLCNPKIKDILGVNALIDIDSDFIIIDLVDMSTFPLANPKFYGENDLVLSGSNMYHRGKYLGDYHISEEDEELLPDLLLNSDRLRKELSEEVIATISNVYYNDEVL